MCWSRGLAISRWRSLPDCLSVCLSVWAVRDVSTPIVGSGVEKKVTFSSSVSFSPVLEQRSVLGVILSNVRG